MATTQEKQPTREEAIEKLARLIGDTRIAMFTTQAGDGTLRSRPMATQQAPFDGVLWFFTGQSTDKTIEIDREAEVNVAYANPDDQAYVSVSGHARILDDRAEGPGAVESVRTRPGFREVWTSPTCG